jgi:glycosyltransferase involved in cell wall biosynthesis
VPVAFNAGGPREIIEHGETGYLYSDADALIETTARLLDPAALQLRQQIGAAARARAAQFSPDMFKQKVRRLIEQQRAKMPA